MVRDQVAPWLRGQGFKGSGNSSTLSRGDFLVRVGFVKRKWNTRELVRFDVDASIGHSIVQEIFREANEEARSLGKVLELPDPGNYWTRLSRLDPAQSSHFPWVVTLDSSTSETATDVIGSIRDNFLPFVETEIIRPLPSPTLPAARANRLTRAERDAESWKTFQADVLPKLREMGVIIEPNE